jgi:hypothetical protein
MPFDTVKTRMQSLQAKSEYKNTLDCVVKTVRYEGVRSLWNGSTVRLGRLVVCTPLLPVHLFEPSRPFIPVHSCATDYEKTLTDGDLVQRRYRVHHLRECHGGFEAIVDFVFHSFEDIAINIVISSNLGNLPCLEKNQKPFFEDAASPSHNVN